MSPQPGSPLGSWGGPRLFLCLAWPWAQPARKATQGQTPQVTSHPSCVPESLGRMGKRWLARKQRHHPAVSNQRPRLGFGGGWCSLRLLAGLRGWKGTLPTQQPSHSSPRAQWRSDGISHQGQRQGSDVQQGLCPGPGEALAGDGKHHIISGVRLQEPNLLCRSP